MIVWQVEVENRGDDVWSLVYESRIFQTASDVRDQIHMHPFAARIVEVREGSAKEDRADRFRALLREHAPNAPDAAIERAVAMMEQSGDELYRATTLEAGNSGMCQACLAACTHDAAPCPFCSPCEHVEQEQTTRAADGWHLVAATAWRLDHNGLWYDTCDGCVTTHGPWRSEEQAQASADEHNRAAGHGRKEPK